MPSKVERRQTEVDGGLSEEEGHQEEHGHGLSTHVRLFGGCSADAGHAFVAVSLRLRRAITHSIATDVNYATPRAEPIHEWGLSRL
jgi:hypothetical protein